MRGKSSRIFLVWTAVLAGVLIICAGCEKKPEGQAQEVKFEIDKAYDRGPLNVHVRVSKKEITIAETLQLQVETAIEPGYDFNMPQINKAVEQFGLVDWNKAAQRLDEAGRIVQKYTYRLEPFLSGSYSIGEMKFEFSDPNGGYDKKYELLTEPVAVEVKSLMDEGLAQLEIVEIEDVAEIPRKIAWGWIASGVGACVALAGAAGGWLYICRKRAARLIRIFKPAHEIAYDLLRELAAEDLISAGKIKEFYERISNILRHYIEHRFALRAPERTTEEFLADLAQTDVLASGDKEDLKQFLTHCDLVKFARHDPTTEQIQRTFDLVKEFIEKTRSDEKKVDVTDVTEQQPAAEGA